MATFLNLYNDVELKLKKTALFISNLKLENEKLSRENTALSEENSKLQAELSELKEKYRLLTITKTIENKKEK